MKMQLIPRWAVDTTGDIRDAATGKVVWFKTGMPTDGLPDLVANAPEMYKLIQLLAESTKQDYAPSISGAKKIHALHQLQEAAEKLLDKIEGGGE